ncbi:short chain dehydrogenase/reductase family [Rhodotorula sp. JG-1b]|nr:short chain dehydrogenase/reductase family [Rhodotorula sp. JG-1b]
MSDLFSVQGKIVLVTGGAKGVGWGITNGYMRGGAARVYIASRDEKSLKEAADEFNSKGYPGKCVPLTANLASYEGVIGLVQELEKREKCLHVLVNNSGNNWGAPFDEYPDAAWDRVLTLNLRRVFTLTQKLTPLLLKSHGRAEGPWSDPARIIMIGSVDGIRVPSLETYAYSASKAALHQMSRVLAGQLGKRGITCNTLACGPFQSKMMAATLEAGRDAIVGRVPLARIGEPDDVAGACLFLSSRAGSYVNGATIALDGGSLVSANL